MNAIDCANCGRSLTPQQAGGPCPACGSTDRNLAARDQAVVIAKAKMADELAQKHFEIEEELTRIFRYSGSAEAEADPTEPVKLLEENAATVSAGVLPLRFGPVPSSGFNYPSVIIEVTPDELRRIESRELELPEGWVVREELPKSRDR